MNIFHKVTLQSLIKNKTRTIVTVIGIILSAAMICAVTTFASSIYNYALDNAIYMDGDWHGSAEDASWSTYEFIRDHPQISGHVYAQQLGYARVQGCVNEYKPYLFVLGAGEGFEKTMPVHITSGRYPASTQEILIPNHLRVNGGIALALGDKLELNLGKRVLDGYTMGQNNPFYVYDENNQTVPTGETLEVLEKRTYTVVGFYDRPSFENYSAPGYTAITVADSDGVQDYACNVWFKMKKTGEVYSFMEENRLSGSTNSSVLRYSGFSRYDGFHIMLVSLSAIVIGLIMLGSVSLIYNAFSISVAERTKQFGLLSSVGATKKQLRHMVVSEALMVSAVGIPLGILAGVGGIGVTLYFVGNKFQSVIGYPIPLRLSVSTLSLVIAVVVAVLTVLISAVIPSRRATRVSAIEAVRQSEDIRIKNKSIRTSKLTYRIFGLPGMLASKYYKRSRRKYRATVLSLIMSVVLFVSAAAFTGELTVSANDSLGNVKYDIFVHGMEEEFRDITVDELLQELKKDTGVQAAAYTQSVSLSSAVFRDQVTREFLRHSLPTEYAEDTAELYVNFKFVDDAAFRALLEENGLDEADYFRQDAPKAVVVDGRTVFDVELEKYTSYHVLKPGSTRLDIAVQKEIEGYLFGGTSLNGQGETVYVYENMKKPGSDLVLSRAQTYEEKRIEIGHILYEAPYYADVNARLTAIYPISVRDSILPDQHLEERGYNYYIISDNHVKTMEAVEKTLEDFELYGLSTFDQAADQEENRNIVTIIQVFAYGFITLISLIAAANVFNTITTNIALRRREFAMLKSVGMTAGAFRAMMNFECVLYGTRALLFGLPVSVGISYLIHLAVSEGYEKSFTLPWIAMAVAVLSVFLVVFSTMMYSMGRIKKNNPIDTLKNENL